MSALEINHVSIVAHDLDESVEFFQDLFGAKPVPTPNFEVPVQWLQCGDRQLHLFERDVEGPQYHHLGVTVDDFDEVYRIATDRELFDRWDDEGDASLFLLPDGAVQMYLRDPSGNLIEVDHPNVETLSPSLQEQVIDRNDLQPQTGEAARATLGLRS